MKNDSRVYLMKVFIFCLCFLGGIQLYAQSNLQIAQEYYKEGEYAKVLQYLNAEEVNHKAAYEVLLGSFLALEQYGDAEALATSFLKRRRINEIEAYTDLLYIYSLSNDDKGVDKVSEKLKRSVKTKPALVYSATSALQKKGYPQLALELYEVAEAEAPNMDFNYQKATLYGELGDIEKMYTMYINMVERSPNYVTSIKNVISQSMQQGSMGNMDFLKELLVKRIQEGGPETMNDLLIHVFIQEQNFRGAFTQLKALDKRGVIEKGRIYNLGNVALNNKEYVLAEHIYDYIMDEGDENPFYEEAWLQKLRAQNAVLQQNNAKQEAWLSLQKDYKKALETLVGTQQTASLIIDMANLTAFKCNDADSAMALLRQALSMGYIQEEDKARVKIKLGDILLYTGERWEAIIYYSQAEKAFEKSPIGQEAKYKKAQAAYFVGDFKWAEGIFNALKTSTSKLIANDAMRYSLLINDNIALDTTMEAMQLYAKADFLHYQGKEDSALVILDALLRDFKTHTVSDEVLWLKSKILLRKNAYEASVEVLQVIINDFYTGILADDALFALADLYENKLGKAEEAQELYQRLFIDFPGSFYTTEARKRYRSLRGDVLN